MNVTFFIILIVILTVYIFLFLSFNEVWFIKNNIPVGLTAVVLPYVIVHIDLKGSPLKLEYLKSLLPILKDNGVNGLIMEYEDMFPYEGKLVNLSTRNCYKRPELKNFLQTAVLSGFEIIPLVQTFGHLEFSLKLPEFRHLREDPAYPDSLCPSKMESRAMVKHMLEQVVNFHNSISHLKHIHVGCDEVYNINKCAQCSRRRISYREIFLDYVKYLSNTIEQLSPNTTMLIWDDMLRHMKPYELNKIGYLNNVEPVYWDYSPNLYVSRENLRNYHKNFKSIWAASAFKGADGKTATIPSIKNRVMNHFNWMTLIQSFDYDCGNIALNFSGIILTGWSRYNHMQPLCELIPVSMPSLLLNLLVIKQFKSGIMFDNNITDVNKFFTKYINVNMIDGLECDMRLSLDDFDADNCNFEGEDLYYTLKQSMQVTSDVMTNTNYDLHSIYLLEFFFKSKNTNMMRVSWCNQTLNKLLDLEANLVRDMKKYYNDEVINEYVALKLFDAKKKLQNTLLSLQANDVNTVCGKVSTFTLICFCVIIFYS